MVPGTASPIRREQYLSLINLATVRDLERVIGAPVDPMRFRGNLYVEGLDPWVELDWHGDEIAMPSGASFRCEGPIDRCAATNVDPATGQRDMAIPRTLMASYGHDNLGVFLQVTAGGRIRVGDPITPR